MANLSSTTPTAPTGKANVTWQTDGVNISGSVSAAAIPASELTGVLALTQLPVIPNTQVSGLGTASTHAATDFDAAGTAATAASSAQTAAISTAEAASLQRASNLIDLANAATARTNLGLGTASTHAATDFDASGSALSAQTTAETFTTSAITALSLGTASTHAATDFDASGSASSAQTAAISTAEAASLQKSANLSDLVSAATARTNLGLGTAATQPSSAFDASGTATSAAATAQATAISTAEAASLQRASNLIDLANAATARTNLGLGSASTHAATDFDASGTATSAAATAQATAISTAEAASLQRASNLSDLASVAAALTNLGTDTQYKLYFNVKAYGALGNGTTDDSAAIASAISAANTAGGGTVFFPAGTYLTGTQLIYSNITYQGAGMDATILKLKPATNSDLFQGSITGYTNGVNGYTGATALVNIAVTVTGQGNAAGCNQFQIRDMALDGNMANQTAGSGGYGCAVRVYGYAYNLENLHIHDFMGDGLYLDYCNSLASGAYSEQPVTEGRLNNIFIYNLGYNGNGSASGVLNASSMGIRLAGPTDSQWSNIIVAQPACHAVHIGPRGAACQIQGMHLWGCYKKNGAVGLLLEGFVMATGLEVECSANGSPNIAVISSGSTLIGGKVFGSGLGNANSYGIQLGAQATDVNFVGAVQSASPNNLTVPAASTMNATYGSNNKIEMPISDCYPGAYYLRYEKNNDISSLLYTYAGSMANPTAAPSLSSVIAGSLAGATYYVKYTYVNATGETLATSETEASLTVAANSELVVASPNFVTGMLGWNVYIGLTSGSETKQNGSTSIAYGTNYTVSAALVAGAALPTTNTTNLMYATAGQSQPAASTGLWSASDTVVINSNALVQNSNAGGTGIVQFSCDYANPAFSVSNGSWQPFKVRTAGGPFAENSAFMYASFLSTFRDYYGSTITSRLDHYGSLYLKQGGIALGTSPSAQTLTTGATVTVFRNYTSNGNEPSINYDGYLGCNNSGAFVYGKVRVTAASAVTGLIMQGTVLVGVSGPSTVLPEDGTETTICNESAYALTFASGGSNLSVPSYVIPANSARKFIFNLGLYQWMPMS